MNTFGQLYPPNPTFTEKHLIDLSSKVWPPPISPIPTHHSQPQKVYIITNATTSPSKALATILYNLHATIYIGARSPSLCNETIDAIKSASPTSKGTLKPFPIDLSNLSTVKPAVEVFKSEEYRLDVLFLTPEDTTPPEGSKTIDGHDIDIATNCLAPFLLVSLLQPIMQNVASHFCHPNQSIRVVWVSSLLTISTPIGGVQLDDNGAWLIKA